MDLAGLALTGFRRSMGRIGGAQLAALMALLGLALAHVALCPFTKVEESFNAQAMHDIHGLLSSRNFSDLASFDHHEFPGVVPRTFVGAFIVTLTSWPILAVLRIVAPHILAVYNPLSVQLDLDHLDGILELYAVRFALALLVWLALVRLSTALSKRFGNSCGTWFAVVCCCQFHLIFYLGRPLPNTYALGLCAYALARWVEGSWEECIGVLSFCTVVFRCDTAILGAWVSLMILIRRETSVFALIVDGIASGLSSLFLTFVVDSIMWNRLLWPEGTVLFFNTVMNKSHEWGVMPAHWYFTNALPKALMAALPLSFLGIVQPLDRFAKNVPDLLAGPAVNGLETSRKILESMIDLDALSLLWIPAMGYVCLYSILPHKEVRFLFQVFPFFNALAAIGLSRLQWASMSPPKSKLDESLSKHDDAPKTTPTKGSVRRIFARLGLLASSFALLASFGVATAHLAVSRANYPGAEALMFVQDYHQKHLAPKSAKVHYCVYAAMSGITRFVEHGSPSLQYSKREDNEEFLASLCAPNSEFQYLIMEPTRYAEDAACASNFKTIHMLQGKPRMVWREGRIATEPALVILEKK